MGDSRMTWHRSLMSSEGLCHTHHRGSIEAAVEGTSASERYPKTAEEHRSGCLVEFDTFSHKV